jgi:RHS repeat-associated protein
MDSSLIQKLSLMPKGLPLRINSKNYILDQGDLQSVDVDAKKATLYNTVYEKNMVIDLSAAETIKFLLGNTDYPLIADKPLPTISTHTNSIALDSGFFTPTLPTTTLTGNIGSGPTLDLEVFFPTDSKAPLCTANITYCEKIEQVSYTESFNGEMITARTLRAGEPAPLTLHLSTGEVIYTDTRPGTFFINPTVKVITIHEKNLLKAIKIVKNNGTTEILEPIDYFDLEFVAGISGALRFDYFLPTKILNEFGHTLNIKWALLPGVERSPFITSVSDSSGELFSSSWPIDGETETSIFPKTITLTLHPATTYKQTTTLEFSNKKIAKSTTSADGCSTSYTYDKDCNPIEIKTSTNIIKTIKYNTKKQVLEYSLTAPNCEKYTELYTYETLKDGKKTIQIQNISGTTSLKNEYTFDNSGNLLITEKFQGDYSEEYRTTYTYDSPSKTLNKKTTRTCKIKGQDKDIQDITVAAFDTAGNLISKTENGVTTEWTYYRGAPKEEDIVERSYRKNSVQGPIGVLGWIGDYMNPIGWLNNAFNSKGLTWGTVQDIATQLKPFPTSDGKKKYNLPIDITCPGDSNFFKVYVESEKIYTLKDSKRIDLQWTFFGYSSVPASNADIAGPAVKPSVKLTLIDPVSDDLIKLKPGSGAIAVETTEYYLDTKDSAHGRVKSLSQKFINSAGTDIELSKQTTEFKYTLADGLLTTETTTISPEKTTDTSVSILEFRSGTLIETTDISGLRTQYTYDNSGRLLKQARTQVGEATTEEIQFEYTQESAQPCVIQRLPSGEISRSRFDYFGRQVASDIQLPGKKTWLTLSETIYDTLDREVKTIEYDYKYDETQLFAIERVTTYDNWGNISKQQIVNGEARCFQYDALNRNIYQWSEYGKNVSEKIKIHYDAQGKIESRAYVNANGLDNEIENYTYDATGRLSKVTPANGSSIQYSYDAFDRTASIQQGDLTTTNEYPSHTRLPVANRATVKSERDSAAYEVGKRKVDGLGRITETNIGGRTQKYVYTGSSSWGKSRIAPIKIVDPSVVTTTSTTYNQFTGAATQSNVSFMQKTTSTSTSYSVRGLQLEWIDDFGNKTSFSYDELGRLKSTTSNKVTTTLTYDGWGRLSSEAVTAVSSGQCVTTNYSYDSQSRETERRFESKDFAKLTLKNTYEQDRLVSSQLLQGTKELRQEKFSYTPLGQLKTYECTGEQKPVDHANKALEKQSFTYDMLGNITTCVSVSGSNSDTATYNYSATDKTQLQSITHTDKAYAPMSYTYDDQGRMSESAQNYTLSYNSTGRLSQIIYNTTKNTYEYLYNSYGQQAECYGFEYYEMFYYRDDKQYARDGLIEFGDASEFRTLVLLNNNRSCKVQQQVLAKTTSYSFELQDMHGSLIASYDPANKSTTFFSYTPFGYRPDNWETKNWLGYNGEPIDRVTGLYHLGNGYRAYDTTIQRFHIPDSLSPFGEGGANGYSYCADPINFHDPDGHVEIGNRYSRVNEPALNNPVVRAVFEGAIGIALAPLTGGASVGWAVAATGIAIVSAGFGIAAAATAQNNPQLSTGLGWASLGTGLASAGVGMFGAKLAGLGAVSAGRQFGSSGWRAENAVATRMVQRRGTIPARNLGSFDVHMVAGNQRMQAAAEIYSGGLDSRVLFIDAHAIARKGHYLNPLPNTEMQFRSGLGTTATDFKTTWSQRIQARTPYRYKAGDTAIPDYVLEEFSIAEHIRSGSLSANFRSELADIAQGTGADILRPLGDMRLSDLLNTLEKEGFHYDRIVNNYCRGTISGTSWGLVKHIRRSLKLF